MHFSCPQEVLMIEPSQQAFQPKKFKKHHYNQKVIYMKGENKKNCPDLERNENLRIIMK